MRKRMIICAVAILLVVAICFAGCSLFGSSGALSSGDSSSGSSQYSSLSRSDLEKELTEYRRIAETMTERSLSLEEAVRQAVSATQQNIGAYAVSYVDSVMNITCMETDYNLGCEGTGFIISEDGYVITNNHVIYYEEEVYDYSSGRGGYYYGFRPTKTVKGVYSTIYATFDEASYYGAETTYTLQFVYRDADLDLALCKLVEEPSNGSWKAIPFYEGTISRGDEVLVLGNAQGFGLSATAGMISATGKTFTDSPKLSFIQTDAAINGGNSGGPAINIYGGLVGVVNSKFVSTNIENMGFAIELSKVKEFISDAQTEKSIAVHYKTVGAESA